MAGKAKNEIELEELDKSNPGIQPAPRTVQITPAQLVRARERLEHLEDPAQEAWQADARERIRDHEGRVEVYERALEQATNRTERRALGPRPNLRLPALPDFEKDATAAARRAGPIFGRFLIEPKGQDPEGGIIHDVTRATEACHLDPPRTFVHFRDELAPAFPDAEPCPHCLAAPAGQA